MGLVALVGLVVALVLVGVGIVVGLVACGAAVVFAALGVVSSSVLLGLLSKRPALGLRAFLIQCGLLVGIPAGAAIALLGKYFADAYLNDWRVLVCGGLGGALAGVVMALLFEFISRRVHEWASVRLPRLGADLRNVVAGDSLKS